MTPDGQRKKRKPYTPMLCKMTLIFDTASLNRFEFDYALEAELQLLINRNQGLVLSDFNLPSLPLDHISICMLILQQIRTGQQVLTPSLQSLVKL